MKFDKKAAAVLVGLCLLINAGFKASNSVNSGNGLLGYLSFLRLVIQCLLGFSLVVYCSMGKFKPINVTQSKLQSFDASHQRPSFTSYKRNVVLEKYLARE
jgi:hypothetical protein